LRYSLPADELPVSSVVFVPAAVAPGVADEARRVGALKPGAITLIGGPIFGRPAHMRHPKLGLRVTSSPANTAARREVLAILVRRQRRQQMPNAVDADPLAQGDAEHKGSNVTKTDERIQVVLTAI